MSINPNKSIEGDDVENLFVQLVTLVRHKVPQLGFCEKVSLKDKDIAKFFDLNHHVIMAHWSWFLEKSALELKSHTFGLLLQYFLERSEQIGCDSENLLEYLSLIKQTVIDQTRKAISVSKVGGQAPGKLGQISWAVSDAEKILSQRMVAEQMLLADSLADSLASSTVALSATSL